MPADQTHNNVCVVAYSTDKGNKNNYAGSLEMEWLAMKVIHITESWTFGKGFTAALPDNPRGSGKCSKYAGIPELPASEGLWSLAGIIRAFQFSCPVFKQHLSWRTGKFVISTAELPKMTVVTSRPGGACR